MKRSTLLALVVLASLETVALAGGTGSVSEVKSADTGGVIRDTVSWECPTNAVTVSGTLAPIRGTILKAQMTCTSNGITHSLTLTDTLSYDVLAGLLGVGTTNKTVTAFPAATWTDFSTTGLTAQVSCEQLTLTVSATNNQTGALILYYRP